MAGAAFRTVDRAEKSIATKSAVNKPPALTSTPAPECEVADVAGYSRLMGPDESGNAWHVS
jgi:hypothetical protein